MSDAITQIRRYSHTFAGFATFAFLLLSLALCWEFATVRTASDPSVAVQYSLIYRFPFIFYLAAIWMMRSAFHSLAKGGLFDDIVPARLVLTGYALLAGAFVTILPTPLMLRYAFGSGTGGLANFDVSAIMLGIVGMMLVLLARLLAQAARMRAELDEFF